MRPSSTRRSSRRPRSWPACTATRASRRWRQRRSPDSGVRSQWLENEMPIEIGQIEAMFRYPVKSMRGESLAAATLGWHGLDGDRRLAFRRLDGQSDFPWLTASNLPDLILFAPQRRQDGNSEALPTRVLTPEGEEMPIFEEALA